MKKCLFFASAILVILSFCVYIDVDPLPEVKFYYINNSSYPIKIIATKTSVSANVLDSLIHVGDTIQYWDYIFHPAIEPFGTPAESTSVTITFYSLDNNRCLKFSEPSVSSSDIRSDSSYFFMGKTIGNKINRCYVLTDEHFNEASPCSLNREAQEKI